jgi:iron(III) transport system ATP-binding protein
MGAWQIMITLKNISKSFVAASGSVRAIRNLSFTIEDGEFFSLLGPSGCGKTTTIRCIAGLENPDDGEIWLGGDLAFSSVRRRMIPVHQRNIGMVFQSYAIWPHMNVFDNVAFPLKYGMENKRRLSQREIKERVMNALALVQLEGVESRPAPQLSGGQQQRVALARALVKNQEVILLDEPLSNLDAKLRVETRLELRQLLKKAKATVVYVTHDQSEAFAVSDRVGVMSDGRLVQVGTPYDIYLRPTDSFIADFVGRVNLLKGEVAIKSGKKVVRTPIGVIECQGLEKVTEGQNVTIGIRAESVKLCDTAERATVNFFLGTVRSAVFVGETTDYTVSFENQLFYVKMPPGLEVSAGDRVGVVLPPESWLVIP